MAKYRVRVWQDGVETHNSTFDGEPGARAYYDALAFPNGTKQLQVTASGKREYETLEEYPWGGPKQFV